MSAALRRMCSSSRRTLARDSSRRESSRFRVSSSWIQRVSRPTSTGRRATWGALADTAKYADPMYALTHPIGAFEHGKDMVEGIVHAEDWRSDRPGLGAGALGFEAVTSVTGVGAAKSATKGAVETAET